MEDATYQHAYFANPQRTVINIEWLYNNEIIEETIPFDENFHAYQSLLDHVSLEQIHSNTTQRQKEEGRVFREYVKQIALEDGMIYVESGHQDLSAFDKVNNYMFGDLFNEEPDKELLFKIKLAAFELDFVKSFKGRKLKSELRKALSIYEIYSILFKIKDEVSN